MDFILRLLHTYKKYDSILMVVDRFSKMIHFIYCSTISNVSHVTRLFLREVVRLHNLLKTIVFKRGAIHYSFWEDSERSKVLPYGYK